MQSDNKTYPYSAKSLRLMYDVSQKTWRKWLKKLNLPPSIKIYTPDQQKQILNHLGEP